MTILSLVFDEAEKWVNLENNFGHTIKEAQGSYKKFSMVIEYLQNQAENSNIHPKRSLQDDYVELVSQSDYMKKIARVDTISVEKLVVDLNLIELLKMAPTRDKLESKRLSLSYLENLSQEVIW